MYKKLKEIFRNSHIIEISEFDSSIQRKLKNIYSITSRYIHLDNISWVIKDKIKVKEIIKNHNKLCKDLSEYLERYNLNAVVNIEDEYIEDEYIRNIICREDIKDEYIDYIIDMEDEEVENDYYM